MMKKIDSKQGKPLKNYIIKAVIWAVIAAVILVATVKIIQYNEKAPDLYIDSIRVYSIIAVFMTLLMYVFYRYAKVSDEHEFVPFDGRNMVVIILTIGLALRLVLTVTAPQCSIDTNLFKYWGTAIAETGFPDAYKEITTIDYPPLYLYILSALGALAKATGIADTSAYTMLVKLPSILADCGIMLFFYLLFLKGKSRNWTFFFLAVWMFNPCAIIDSACWGQVDSFLAFFILAGCYFIEKKKFGWAGFILSLGVLFKPQAIIVLPVFFIALVKNKKFLPWLKAAGSFIATFFLVALPFYIKNGMAEVEIFGVKLTLPWIFSLYVGTADHYSYTSVNALNYWFLKGANWVSDSTPYLGKTYYFWGMLAIVLTTLTVFVLYLICKDRPSLPYVMSSVLMLTVVTFGPRMHERYFFPVVVLLLAAAIRDNDKMFLGLYSGLSFFGFLTVGEIMTDLQVGAEDAWRSYYWPQVTPFRAVLAGGNVAVCVILLVYAGFYTFAPKLTGKKCMKIFKENTESTENITSSEIVQPEPEEKI